MKLNQQIPKNNAVDEVVNFFNQYCALDYDETYIKDLVNKLVNIYFAKLSKNSNEEMINLKFREEDFTNLNPLQRKCTKFHSAASIDLKAIGSIYIDKFGKVINSNINGLDAYNGLNILELLKDLKAYEDAIGYFKLKKAYDDVRNVITQNILVSKLYKAVLAKLETVPNVKEEDIELFKRINGTILEYEIDLKNKNQEVFDINKSYSRIRSKR